MGRVPRVSTSGYYAWKDRPPSRREREDRKLTEEIREVHLWSRGTYGLLQVHTELRARGIRMGRKRVGRLIRQRGLRGISSRRSVNTTRRRQGVRPAPDLVEREFEMTGPNRLWGADITDVPTSSRFLYLSVVLDA